MNLIKNDYAQNKTVCNKGGLQPNTNKKSLLH